MKFSLATLLVVTIATFNSSNCHGRVPARREFPDLRLRARAPPEPRSLTLVLEITPSAADWSQRYNKKVLETHGFVEFGATSTSRAMRVGLISEVLGQNQFQLAIRVLKHGTAGGPTIGPLGRYGSIRHIFHLPQTTFTNTDMFDPTTGRGIVWDAWSSNRLFAVGGGGAYNGDITFISRLLHIVQGENTLLPSLSRNLMELGAEFARVHGDRFSQPLDYLYFDRLSPQVRTGERLRSVFEAKPGQGLVHLHSMPLPQLSDIHLERFDLGKPLPLSGPVDGSAAKIFDDALLADEDFLQPGNSMSPPPTPKAPRPDMPPPSRPNGPPPDAPPSSPMTPAFPADGTPPSPPRGAHVPNGAHVPGGVHGPNGAHAPGTAHVPEIVPVPDVAPPADAVPAAQMAGTAEGTGARTIAEGALLVRYNDALTTIVRVGGPTLRVLGVVGMIAAPVFIILDLVNHQYVGAAFGAVGLLAGLMISFAVEGPVGWLLAGAVVILFAILPGLFMHQKHYPRGNDATGIIQWTMFGDDKHTGNEKCREAGNANCVALYGPGVLARVLSWNNLDATLFLIEFNEGYAMSIPDMAKFFHIIDPYRGDTGENATATIDCQKKKANDRGCKKPRFHLKRERIRLRHLNITGDLVAPRIIPQPGGDCKLVATTATGIFYPTYNLTVHGTPCTIACGITASLNISGSAVAMNDPNNPSGLQPLLSNSVSLDTGDSGGEAFVAAPVAVPFSRLSPSDGVGCLSSTTDQTYQCFPSGTYGKLNGRWGGWDIRHSDEVLLPSNMTFSWGRHAKIHSTQRKTDDGFSKDISQYNAKKDSMTFQSSQEPAVPVVCLYDDVEFKGNVACFGAGGADLSEALRHSAQSISLHGQALAWIYPHYYGDSAGAYITMDIPDLSTVPFGLDGSFSGQVAAMWINS